MIVTIYDIIESLEAMLEQAEGQVVRLRTAITALASRDGNGNPQPPAASEPSQSTAGVTPPIIDICRYLAQQAGPAAQNDIISAVGELRTRRYPSLGNHYSNVWRAIEYHIRHHKLIRCVDQDGNETELKPLPKRAKGQKLYNSPELYQQDNYFVLKEEDAEEGQPRISQKGFNALQTGGKMK